MPFFGPKPLKHQEGFTFKVKNTQHNSQIKKSTEVLHLGAGFMFWKRKCPFDRLNLNFKKVQWKNFQSFSDTNSNNFRLAKSQPNNFRLTSLPHSFGSLNSLIQAMEIEFGLLGDSSLYTKRANKRKSKSYISEELLVPLKYISYSAASLLELRWLLPGNGKLEHKVCPGGVKEFNHYF